MSCASPRLSVFVVLVLFGLGGWSPTAAADAHGRYGATPGDPVVLDDASECLAQVAARPGVQCSVLYGHIFDLLNRVPINVQRPPADAEDLSDGFTSIGYEPMFGFNSMTLYSSPGFVEYPENGDGKPRLHPDRGLARNVHIAADAPIVGHWYMAADASDFSNLGQDPDADVGLMPCLSVQMTLQLGNHWGDGLVVAQGTTTKHVLTTDEGTAGTGVPAEPAVPCPGAAADAVVRPETVTDFRVVLEPIAEPPVISREDGFILHVEWHQFDPTGDGEHRIFPQQYNVRSGGEHRPRLVVPLVDALVFEKVETVPYEGKTYLRGHVSAPWGAYDLDHSSLRTELADAEGALVDTRTLELRDIDVELSHGGLMRPVVVHWQWDPLAEDLAPGTYTLRLSAQNWQHTVTAVEDLPVIVSSHGRVLIGDVEVVPGVVEEAGGLVPLAALALVGLLWTVGRRARCGAGRAS